jgi:hypothetical protein
MKNFLDQMQTQPFKSHNSQIVRYFVISTNGTIIDGMKTSITSTST